MRSYENHLQQLSGHQAQKTLRKPTFRSSAIFPIFHLPGISTRICYLGYWMIKRNIKQIHSVVTLRSSEGEIIYRSSNLIEEPKAYRIEITDLLKQIGLDEWIEFLGSLEVEFFSIQDMVFPYPAVIVNYYGPTFSSVVHTSQRIFNDTEDRSSNLEVMVPESGFTIYASEDREPFFTFINGCEQVTNCKLQMQFINHKQETLLHEITIDELPAYQISLIHPSNSLDLITFLDGKPGTAKISFDVKWVFPRIIAGNYQHSINALSVTHTYYDCSEATHTSDYWREAEPGYHAASLMIPVTIEDDCFTNIYLYPIYSPSEFELDIEIYSAEGDLLGTEYKIQRIISPGREIHEIKLKSICLQLNIDPNQTLVAKIIASPMRGSKLPARIKIGLDYGVNQNGLPCNICKNIEVFNPQLEQKKRSFHWAPVLTDQENSTVWLVNSTQIQNYTRVADIELTFYREQDTLTMQRKFTVAANGVACIRLNEDLELLAFFGGEVGWYTAISANPYATTYYLSQHSSGVVGGDHDF
ncbi:hypothetical protein EHS13_05265 [Paenibacillus psychroresistens]|uniref:Uncharacterized protein n=1 Tax=Paenibacillus psychroresistens TaxID=1778678 RepID=A0A6B8RG65_9BACL|nr:hypothetical protein [Paenibacillus psychroresistens]QGQ94356.1 hypothetical protein EHS13_05265 [Paenibacillus psychroresistens]